MERLAVLDLIDLRRSVSEPFVLKIELRSNLACGDAFPGPQLLH